MLSYVVRTEDIRRNLCDNYFTKFIIYSEVISFVHTSLGPHYVVGAVLQVENFSLLAQCCLVDCNLYHSVLFSVYWMCEIGQRPCTYCYSLM